MLSSLILALGLSTSPAEAPSTEIVKTPLNSIEQISQNLSRRSDGKARISFNDDLSRRSDGKARISFNDDLSRRSDGKARI